MSGQPMVIDTGYAKAIEEALVPLLATRDFPDVPEIIEGEPGDEVNVVETYEEAMLAGGNAGLVLHMASGAEVRMTIQAYVPRGGQ